MDLQLRDHHFIVCGASSGFGRAISELLIAEHASVTGVARRKEELETMREQLGERFQAIAGDLTDPQVIQNIIDSTENGLLHGVVINGGGPPAKSALESTLRDWDESYDLLFRWKVDLAGRLVHRFRKQGYGRILFIESQSVKQPIENLVLSNSMRLAVVGFAQTLSKETARDGITVNILAPGSHDTPAIERIVKKRAELRQITNEIARTEMENLVPVGRFGKPQEFASLAAWLLSPLSSYVTGQTLSHDGGSVRFVFG